MGAHSGGIPAAASSARRRGGVLGRRGRRVGRHRDRSSDVDVIEPDTSQVGHRLAAVQSAMRVERLQPTGSTRAQRRRVGDVVDARMLDAVEAGATIEQIAQVLGRGVDTARKRLRHARLQAPDRFPDPDHADGDDEVGVSLAPRPAPVRGRSAWREVPACHRPAPPPWPVNARCGAPRGHRGDHRFDRTPRPGSLDLQL